MAHVEELQGDTQPDANEDYSPETPIAPGKFRLHAKIADSLIGKGGSPISLYGRLRGQIVFAPKNGQNMLYGRPEYPLNHKYCDLKT